MLVLQDAGAALISHLADVSLLCCTEKGRCLQVAVRVPSDERSSASREPPLGLKSVHQSELDVGVSPTEFLTLLGHRTKVPDVSQEKPLTL